MKRIAPVLAAVLLLAGCAPHTPSESASPSPSSSASASPSASPSQSPSETPTPGGSSDPAVTPTPEETNGGSGAGPAPVPPTVDTSAGLAEQTQKALLASLQVAQFSDTCSQGAPYCYIAALSEPSAGVVVVNFTAGAQAGNTAPLAASILSSVAGSVPGLKEIRTAINGVQVGTATR
ncbi:cytoskeletal protein RodZ [Mycetocola sp. BIGb0189]|uniref:hypothetical protein n=1 Tax=Mycetocola sp. BIGb0189 TaxID=2940604 RepID=UPI002167A407|nr:hypothetical protein [Mycetocola sp. BIGb0189]MCS4276776.1 cytoskeletal protein RodZ [Mycetocola sp. BIGb0189]